MKAIKRDYMRKELRRLALCAAGLFACLGVLSWCYPRLAALQPLPLLGVTAVIALAALRAAVQARAGVQALTDTDAYSLEREYAAPHPVYKVWQGEMHLMQNFIVCRNRGRLMVIPIHKIEQAERRFDRMGVRKVPYVKFTLDTGRSISIGFPVTVSKDDEAVFLWLTKRLGGEKVKL